MLDTMHPFTKTQALQHPPLRTGGWQDVEHYLLFRSQEFDYRTIAHELAGQRVLDWGCNNGYGSRILSQHSDVVGIDVSQRLVEDARRLHPDLHFEQIDGVNTRFASGSMDAVILFQVIEHLPDPATVLFEIKRVLAPLGRLYLSTPNATARLRGDPPWNPFHVTEFSAGDLTALLRSVFPAVRLQGLRAIDIVDDIERRRWEKRRIARRLELSLVEPLRALSVEHSTDDYTVETSVAIHLRSRSPAARPSISSIEIHEAAGELFHYSDQAIDDALSLRAVCERA
jgi:SAM-dependent methyltransferase